MAGGEPSDDHRHVLGAGSAGAWPDRPEAGREPAPGETSVLGVPMWLCGSVAPSYAVLHTAAAPTGTVVVMVSPFGWDDLISYRARRAWAIRLAQAGYSTLRFDLPGTGDSVGLRDDTALADGWTGAIREHSGWLAERAGAERVVGLGIGLGGLLTLAAIAEGAEIDDVVLWASRARGRSAVRELVVAANLLAHPSGPSQGRSVSAADGDGPLDVGGFLISRQTLAALTALDVGDLDIPNRGPRAALLLGRDAAPADAELERSLAAKGFTVNSVSGSEYVDLMGHPQSITAHRPEATMRRTIDWLARRASSRRPAPRPSPVSARTRVQFGAAGAELAETIVGLSLGPASTSGILTVPAGPAAGGGPAPIGAVLLNAGAMRRTGIGDRQVELARRWAALGVPTLRFDLEAIGDAEGPGDRGEDERPLLTGLNIVSVRHVDAVVAVLEQLRARRIAERFVLVGHCSGAYLGFQAALADPNVIACFGSNQMGFLQDEDAYHARTLQMMRQAVRKGLWARIREGRVSRHDLGRLAHALRHRLWPARSVRRGDPLARGLDLLDELMRRAVMVELFFARDDLFRDDLKRLGVLDALHRWPHLRIHDLPTDDHELREARLAQLLADAMTERLTPLLRAGNAANPPARVK